MFSSFVCQRDFSLQNKNALIRHFSVMQIRRGFPQDVKGDKLSIAPFVTLPCHEPIRLENENGNS